MFGCLFSFVHFVLDNRLLIVLICFVLFVFQDPLGHYPMVDGQEVNLILSFCVEHLGLQIPYLF